MRITRLNLANVRSIEVAEFRFHPGFNLIVDLLYPWLDPRIRLGGAYAS